MAMSAPGAAAGDISLRAVTRYDVRIDYPASTMQIVNALIKADKDFDLLYMPGAGHGVARLARLGNRVVSGVCHLDGFPGRRG